MDGQAFPIYQTVHCLARNQSVSNQKVCHKKACYCVAPMVKCAKVA